MLHFRLMTGVNGFLRDLLLQSGARLKKQFGNVRTVQYKAGAATNLVTNVDKDIENYIKRAIRKSFPGDGILAEESAASDADASRKWIIDPLDGTTNFAHGYPCFSISIAVESGDEITAGGVYNPVYEEFFFAVKGKGATLNGKRIRVSTVRTLNRALLVTGFPYDIQIHPERSLPYFNALIQKAQGMRRLGSAALDLCYVAMGRFDGFFEVQLNPWDTAAGALILREAGGTLCDFDGRPFSIYRPELVATNGKISKEMLQIIGEIKSAKRRAGVL